MEVNVILAVVWTTKVVENEPEKIQAWRESNPDLGNDQMQLFNHWANQANWRLQANCKFLVSSVVEMTWLEN